jgi:hypothetical protein
VITIGGFSGAFRDRAWKEVDEELDAARRERFFELPRAGCSSFATPSSALCCGTLGRRFMR